MATNYYFHNGRRLAKRTGNDGSILHADHLQSTTNTSGDETSRPQYYYPCGAMRGGSEVATDYQYTGQRCQGRLWPFWGV